MKFVQTDYNNRVEILKFPDHYVNIAVTVSDTGVAADANGKKVLPAGTIVGGGVLADPTVEVTAQNTVGGNAEGVLFNDVDVTHGPAPAAMLIHGFVAIDKLPEAPHEDAVAALKQVAFIK